MKSKVCNKHHHMHVGVSLICAMFHVKGAMTYDPISNVAVLSSSDSSPESYLPFPEGGLSMWAWVTWVACGLELVFPTAADNRGRP